MFIPSTELIPWSLLDVDASTPSKSTKISISAFSRSCYHKKEEITIIFFFQYSAADYRKLQKKALPEFWGFKISMVFSMGKESLWEKSSTQKNNAKKNTWILCDREEVYLMKLFCLDDSIDIHVWVDEISIVGWKIGDYITCTLSVNP
jgi:hypothetical protein